MMVDDDLSCIVLRRYFLWSACRSHLIKNPQPKTLVETRPPKKIAHNGSPTKTSYTLKNLQSSPTQNPKHKKEITQSSKVQNHLPTKIPNPKKISPKQTQTVFFFFSVKGTAGRAARCAWGDPSEGTQQGSVRRRVRISPIQSYDLGMGFFHHQSYSIVRGLDSWGYVLEIWWIYPFSHNHGSVENHPKRKETHIGDTSIFHWTMIMGGRASWWWMLPGLFFLLQ